MDDDGDVTEHLNKSSPFSFLTEGSQVEVSSGEAGFDGGWFVATVIHTPPSILNLVYVEYHDLSCEDGSSQRLREYANVSFLRPSPPPTTSDFEVGDVVDAFCRDGWWTGVVKAVVDRSNFVVEFRNPSHEFQFHVAHLRVHSKWVDGKWVLPGKQRTAGLIFSVGKKVEVCFEKEDFLDVWFPATVVEHLGNGSFLVENQCSGISGTAESRKVTVDHLHIRPSPPHLRDKNFALLEKVDVFCDFGWWSGVITKELGDNRYVVFFKHTNKEREFSHLDLRQHMEWRDGKWFSASQDSVGNNVHGTENIILHEGRAPCSLNRSEPIELINPESSVLDSSMKRTKQPGFDNNDKHSQLSKKSKGGIVSDDPSLSNTGQSKEVSSPSFGQSGEGNSEEATIFIDNAFSKTETLSHGKKMRSKRGKDAEPNGSTVDSARKKEKSTVEFKSPRTLAQGSLRDSLKTTTEKEQVTKDPTLPIVIGLQCNETQQSDVLSPPKATVNTEGKEVDAETVTLKRKRGRPPKSQAKNPKTPLTVGHENGDTVPGAVSSVEEGTEKNAVGSPRTAIDINKLPNEISGKVPTAQIEKFKSVKGKRGKRRTISVNTDVLAQDSQDAFKEKPDGGSEKDSVAGNSETPVENSVGTVSDDQPLSRWFEGMHSPPTMDSSAAAPQRSVEIPPATPGSENRFLPFVKYTPLWQTIESMEAFRMIPQNPHFRPLENVKESAREGLAICSMVNFSSVVETTSRLRSHNPRTAIEDCLETLVELETHGFDVKLVRDRLIGLLVIKDRQEELETKSKELGEKIEEDNVVGRKLDEEIEAIDGWIRELREKRAWVASKKENKAVETAALGAAADGVDRGLQEVRVEFDGLVAAPW